MQENMITSNASCLFKKKKQHKILDITIIIIVSGQHTTPHYWKLPQQKYLPRLKRLMLSTYEQNFTAFGHGLVYFLCLQSWNTQTKVFVRVLLLKA